MSYQPLVSVVTPLFNREKFIGETIESVLSQTYGNWELIIIDDGSTDKSKEVVEKYLRDKRICYHFQINSGQSVARNQGIQKSKGEYIAFLDSDDVWLPTFLETSLSEFKNDRVGLTNTRVICVDEFGVEIHRPDNRKFSGKVTKQLLRDSFVAFSSVVTKRELVEKSGGFDTDIKLAADYDLLLRLSFYCEFCSIEQRLMRYRVMEEQLSSNLKGRFEFNEKILKRFKKNYPSAVTKAEWRHGFSEFYHRKARYYLSIKKYSKALRTIFISFCYDPFWIGPYRVFLKTILSALRFIHPEEK